MPRRLLPVGVLLVWMSAGLLILPVGADEKPVPRRTTDASATTQRLQNVTFHGAKHIKEGELRTLTGLRPGMPLDPTLNRDGCQKILEKYEAMGRPFTSCELIKGGDPNDTEVIYSIIEGPRVKVRDIQFIGNTFVSGAQLVANLRATTAWFHLPGGSYHRKMAESDITELTNFYRSFGYQNAKVALETQTVADGAEVILIFHIQEGVRQQPRDARQTDPRKPSVEQLDGPVEIRRVGDFRDANERKEEQTPARIAQIIITGNERISSESILAHVPLFPGQILRYSELRKAENALAELGLFVIDPAKGIRPTVTVLDYGTGYNDILITVKEKRNLGKPR